MARIYQVAISQSPCFTNSKVSNIYIYVNDTTSSPFLISYNSIKEVFPRYSDHTLGMLAGLLTYNSKTRLNVKQALAHPYFQESPRAQDPSLLPTYPEVRNQLAERERYIVANNSNSISISP